jgi:hypothetical protein
MVRPNKFNQRPPAPPEPPPPPYNAALFEDVDSKDFRQFQSRLITTLRNDHDASIVRVLSKLHDECHHRYRFARSDKEQQDRRLALIERFGQDNGAHDNGDPLLEALYHLAAESSPDASWVEGALHYYGHPDDVPPPRYLLRTRQ